MLVRRDRERTDYSLNGFVYRLMESKLVNQHNPHRPSKLHAVRRDYDGVDQDDR